MSKSRPPAISVAGSFPLVYDMNRQEKNRLTQRALIESCELRWGEFLIAPIPAHRRRDKRPHCLQPWSCDSTSGQCQMEKKKKRNEREITSWFRDLSSCLLFHLKWKSLLRRCGPHEPVRKQLVATCGASQIREGFLLFLFIVCRFLCVVLGFGPLRWWRRWIGQWDGPWLPRGFCFVAHIIRFSSFWRSNKAGLIKFGCLYSTADCSSQREGMRLGMASLERLKDIQEVMDEVNQPWLLILDFVPAA